MEANEFAANLLMPWTEIAKDLNKTKITIDNLKKIAYEKYNVSLFTLANRLVEYTKNKYAIIQSENWKILKTFSGSLSIVDQINDNSITASFF